MPQKTLEIPVKTGVLSSHVPHLGLKLLPNERVQLGAKLRHVGAKLGPSWSQMGPSWAQLVPLLAEVDHEWPMMRPYWIETGPICKRRLTDLPQSHALFGGSPGEHGPPQKLHQTDRSVHSCCSPARQDASAPSVQADWQIWIGGF